ncbi:hypothetical protein DPMN_007974 [Dreissena polymorpha]|uniref:Integrase zinc-binding domain-containing protein n=1 Tax=Dreissena polymorpha TaxID=45954 RepID=A0A9D4MYC0_DREPO|nr:hypothetical protein DPMN_007974 [Dreissena polymorpha]
MIQYYLRNVGYGCDLYRFVAGNVNGLKVVLKEDVKNALKALIGSAFGGHSGMDKTRDAITIRYWWPELTEDITKYVRIHV